MKLKNKTIIITGASQGLGETLAYKTAEEGTHVILVARTEKFLETIKRAIIEKGGKADYFVCDIRDADKVKSTVKDITAKFPNIDILVNNAGVWTDDELEKERTDSKKNALLTNALGNIQFIDELLPIFKKQNSGYIFNVISTSAVSDIDAGNNTMWKTYGASKWAMAGYTKALKDSLRDTKIKVTGFFPGGFESNLYENADRPDPHNQPWMMKKEDVADVIVFALTRPDDVLMERIIVTKMM